MRRISLAFAGFSLLSLLSVPLFAQVWAGPAGIEIEVSSKGKPVVGARVLLRYREAPQGTFAVLTDAKGKAAVVNLAAGAWNIEVSHEDFLSYVAAVTLEPGKKASETTSFLQATGAGRNPIRVRYGKASRAIGTPVEAPQPAPRAADPIPAPTPAPAEPTPEPEPEPVELRAPDIPAPTPREPAVETPAEPEPIEEPKPTPAPPAPEPVPEPEPEMPIEAPVPEPAPVEMLEPEVEIPEPASAPEPEPVTPPAPPEPDVEMPEVSEPPVEQPVAVEPEPQIEPTPTPAVPEPEPVQPPTPPAAVESEPALEEVPEPRAPAADPVEVRSEEPEAETAPLPAPTAEPEPEPPVAEPAPEPVVQPEPAADPAPAPAPVERVPSPSLRAFRDRTCPECKPGEWSAASVEIGEALGSGACPENALDLVREAARRVARAPEGSLKGFAGPAIGGVSPTAEELLAGEARSGVHQAVSWTTDSCRILAVAIPRNAKFQGFRYEAADDAGQADCVGDKDCPIGDSRFLDNPGIERGREVTVVYSVFENRSTERQRRARLTVYFVPASGWRP